MNEQKHPELHVNEEPRNDFADVATGFGVFFVILLVIAILATVIQVMTR
jgi:hypothetical protein